MSCGKLTQIDIYPFKVKTTSTYISTRVKDERNND
jgi:hypothetical protein